MNIKLSDHFTYKKLLRFCLSPIIMMVFTSIYGVVDGLFVSNYVGKTAFAAINLVMPFIMIFGGIGFMFGTGGSALVAKTLGLKDSENANRYFTMMSLVTLVVGIIISIVGMIFMRPIAIFLGAENETIEHCVIYGRIIIGFNTAFMLQNLFQSFLITAEKPKLGLWVTVAAGVTNMALDALFVAGFRWGLVGAALATSMSELVGGAIPVVYFMKKNTSLLRLTKFRFDIRILGKAASNGASEFMNNVSASLVSMLYNMQLMKYAGENGIAAYGVVMYVNFIFQAIFMGYSVGSAPIVGFNYGSGNKKELKSILGKGIRIIVVGAFTMFVLGQVLARPLAQVFVGYDKELFDITVAGFMIFSCSFLFSGFPILGSSFFTALSDGLTSALISFLRTLVFQVTAVLILPVFFKLTGVWMSVVVAEFLAMIATIIFLVAKKKKYGY